MRNALMLFGALIVLSSKTVCAQSQDNNQGNTYRLEESTVNGSRVPLQLNQTARIVTILDTLAIRAIPAQTVNDLLKYAIGVDVRQRGSEGVQTDIGIRGGTFDQIAVLLNGINICDPQTNHFALDMPVDISEIERIEILEGPAGRVYGTSSLVGAINIVTKTAKKPGADFHIEGGSYGYLNGGLRANTINGRFNNQVSANYSRSDGYNRNAAEALNSDYEAAKAFYQGKYSGKDADIRWQAGISGKGFGANTFYSAKYDSQYEKTLKTYTAIHAETKGVVHFKPEIYWNHSNDKFELFRGSETKVPYNYHRTNVYGVNINAYFESLLGKTSFGSEMRNEGIESTTLGDTLSSPIHIKGTNRDYIKGLNRTNISFFLEHDIILNRFTLSGGLTAVKNTGTQMNFRIYPGADASLRLLDNWKVYASYNTSLRMPTFTELYYSVGGHMADKYLKPEEMSAYETGLKYLRPGIRVQASIYYHHGTNMIDWIKDTTLGTDAPWKSVNHTEINTTGEEFSSMFDLQQLFGSSCFIDNIYVGYSHIDQDKELEANEQSKYAMEYLRNKVVAKLDMHFLNHLYVNLAYRWQERVGNYELFTDGKDAGKMVSYKPFSLVDAKISWNEPRYDIFVNLNNIFDYTYYDHGNIPQPGIWIKGGIVYRLAL